MKIPQKRAKEYLPLARFCEWIILGYAKNKIQRFHVLTVSFVELAFVLTESLGTIVPISGTRPRCELTRNGRHGN